MNCTKCGAYNAENLNYCTNCGAQLNNNQMMQQPMQQQYAQQPMMQQSMQQQYTQQPMNNQQGNPQVGQITLARGKNFFGMLASLQIYIDGVLVGKIKNGQTLTFPIYYGYHKIELRQFFSYGERDININEYQNNQFFRVELRMGLLTNKIDIL